MIVLLLAIYRGTIIASRVANPIIALAIVYQYDLMVQICTMGFNGYQYDFAFLKTIMIFVGNSGKPNLNSNRVIKLRKCLTSTYVKFLFTTER